MYLDETWANAHDGKRKAWVEEDIITKGTIGEIQGYVLILYSVFVKYFLIVNHLEKENDLLCYMQVARMDGFPVSE